jgi:hypothetical protein
MNSSPNEFINELDSEYAENREKTIAENSEYQGIEPQFYFFNELHPSLSFSFKGHEN